MEPSKRNDASILVPTAPTSSKSTKRDTVTDPAIPEVSAGMKKHAESQHADIVAVSKILSRGISISSPLSGPRISDKSENIEDGSCSKGQYYVHLGEFLLP